MRKWVATVSTLTLVLGLATVASGHGEHISGVTQGVFSTTCGSPRASHHLADDPIVYPGQPGASHMHEFFGNDSTNAFSTYDSMTAATTDCIFLGDTAGYWVPALQRPDGSIVEAYNHWVYIRDFGCDTDAWCRWGQELQPIPAGLKIVSGYPNDNNWYWRCPVNGVSQDTRFLKDCDDGTYLTFEVSFPQCWDGVHLDSPDHRSHMSNAFVTNAQGERVCPASHPVRLPALSVFALWVETNSPNNQKFASLGYRLSSDHAGDVAGSTLHADFWNTWDQDEMERITQTCLIDHGDIPESPDDVPTHDPSCLQSDSQFAPPATTTTATTTMDPPTTTVTPPPPPNPTPQMVKFCKRHPDHRRCQ